MSTWNDLGHLPDTLRDSGVVSDIRTTYVHMKVGGVVAHKILVTRALDFDFQISLNGLVKILFYRNWYVFNVHNTRFEDYGLYMQRGHNRADFTRIPEDAAMLRNCKLN